ncbi:5'-methylthioadenosine/adenosylhomocysteine nucleosidase, partial [Xanthomonas citri pv. citri]|nr:5'-methylthioadenosine/adenosylhomocysteine nucleosidase [Xanthomonas citri pv. citri]
MLTEGCKRVLGLMGAMEDEVRLIRADLDDVEELD